MPFSINKKKSKNVESNFRGKKAEKRSLEGID
jgi:hypothetical protein